MLRFQRWVLITLIALGVLNLASLALVFVVPLPSSVPGVYAGTFLAWFAALMVWFVSTGTRNAQELDVYEDVTGPW